MSVASAKVLKPYVPEVREAAVRVFDQRYPNLQFAPVVVVIAAFEEEGGLGGVLEGHRPRSPRAGRSHPGRRRRQRRRDQRRSPRRTASTSPASAQLRPRGRPAPRLRLARDHGARYIVTLDGDGQWDPHDVPMMLEPLVNDEADFVLGSRVLGRSDNKDAFRQIGVHVFAALVRILTGTKVTDTSTGLRAMRAEITATVRQEQVQYQTSELLIGAIYQGYRIAERPIVQHQRVAGESKKGNDVLYGARYARVVVRTWWRERRAGGRPVPTPSEA